MDGDWAMTICELPIDLSVLAMQIELCDLHAVKYVLTLQLRTTLYPNMIQLAA